MWSIISFYVITKMQSISLGLKVILVICSEAFMSIT